MEILNKKIQKHFEENMSSKGVLFRVEMSGREIWDLYLNSFSQENDPIFRDPESSVHNCNHCKNFIRRYGNIVAIDENYNLISLFDINQVDEEYSDSIKAISNAIKSSKVIDIFSETYSELNSLPYESCDKNQKIYRLGFMSNVKRYTKEESEKFGVVKPNELKTFHHFYLDILSKYVDKSGDSVEQIMAFHRDNKNVFKRAMDEISLDTLKLVKDLINQDSILNGTAHLVKIEDIIKCKEEYDQLSSSEKDNWCWVKSHNYQYAKFRNELIGVLCTELSQGEDLNKACLNWNKRVDPANYMKAKAPITKTQIKLAKKYVDDNGYEDSFNRRYATIEDIVADEILHLNSGSGEIVEASIFDKLKGASKKSSHSRNKFDKVQEISIDKFMKDILPSTQSLEVFLENKHQGNMMTLTTSNVKSSKSIFKYSNNYSQTFNGNLAGKSEIKSNVSNVGGNIDALVRCSLQWNDKDTPGIVDFDLHCKSIHSHIYFQNKGKTHKCGGHLDVDMINPPKVGIENITWEKDIKDGVYLFGVKNYNGATNTGFKVEIEFQNEVFNYHIDRECFGFTNIATIIVENGEISIKHHVKPSNSSRKIYGLDTIEFHKVNLMCLSPNHWGDNKVGDKYYLFLLDKCKVPTSIRSFHNVDLIPELQKHRKVLDVLGNQCMIEPNESKQLSGIGINSTVREELLVRVKGTHNRVLKIKF